MSKVFEKEIMIRFREADPARIMYFGNLFSIAHDCFEDFIIDAGFTWNEWFSKGPYMIPIRHTECDYLAPFVPGEKYRIQTTVAEIRTSSFKMKYTFLKGSQMHAELKMVHAVLDSKTHQKIPIPAEIRNRLNPYLEHPNK